MEYRKKLLIVLGAAIILILVIGIVSFTNNTLNNGSIVVDELGQNFELKFDQSSFLRNSNVEIIFVKHIPGCPGPGYDPEADCAQRGIFALQEEIDGIIYAFGQVGENYFNTLLEIGKGETIVVSRENSTRQYQITLNGISGSGVNATAKLSIYQINNTGSN